MDRDEKMKNLFKKIKKDESGATAIEYGLIAALIAVVLISSLGLLGNNIKSSFGKISNSVGTAR
jgi:pilus assembly protein Flp/PilA